MIKNQLNAKTFKKIYEQNSLPSMTIPDQSMTVREIMDRFTRGLPLNAGKVPIYEGEEYTPDITKMDLADKHDWIENVFQRANEIQQQTPDNQVEEQNSTNNP
jgi:hypothetical protein